MDKQLVIDIKDLTKSFGGLCAVNGFSGELYEGQIVGIIGPNGAGKTTILNMISGVYPPSSGSVVFNGKDISKLEPEKINHLGIARTFQNIRLFQDLTVLETVMTAYSWRAPYYFFETLISLPRVRKYENESREICIGWKK